MSVGVKNRLYVLQAIGQPRKRVKMAFLYYKRIIRPDELRAPASLYIYHFSTVVNSLTGILRAPDLLSDP